MKMSRGPQSERRPEERPRLGLLTTSYPRHATDPAGPFVEGYARALVNLGWSVDVLAPADAEPLAGTSPRGEENASRYVGAHAEDAFISVHRVPYMPRPSWQTTFYGAGVPDNLRASATAWPGTATYPFALYLAARKRAHRWEAFVSHWATPCAWVAGHLRGRRPHLAVLHSADVHLLTQKAMPRVLAKKILSGATSLQFVSSHHRHRFVQKLAPRDREVALARSFVLPMGVESRGTTGEDRDALRARLGLSRFTLLSLGRLVPIKGLEVLLDAVRGLNVDVVVAGEGPLREALKRHAPPSQVRFVGYVTGEHKRALLTACDAFVLPSMQMTNGRTEGMPVALLEAIEHGLPVIASALPGLEDVVRGAGGLLVEPANPSALRAAICSAAEGRITPTRPGSQPPRSWQAQGPTLQRHLSRT